MNKKMLTTMIIICLVVTLITGVTAETMLLGERELQIGARGEDVALMQELLNENDYREGHIDGIFGPLTYGSLIKFQDDHDLEVDGVVDGKTMVRMQELLQETVAKQEVTAMNASAQTLVATAEHKFTAAEIELFGRIVHAEAAGESFDGQVAVAATILNRVESDLYPNTISGVVYQVESGKYQYSPVLDGRINQAADASAKRAVQEALKGLDPTGGATGFYNPSKTSNAWVRSHPVTATIGSHVFFKY
ncbi:MAG: cell wall hydrolase [Firmicutes bacterium]|nr:cell wall hydrolase [Bacillota bacterium]